MAIATVSPVTGEVLESFDELTPEELEDKLARAAAAAESYRLTSVEQRAGWLGRAADNLEKDADSVSRLITTEVGKTYRAAQEEVAKCVRGLRFYAAEGPGFLRNLPGDAGSVGAKQTYVSYQPIGVVLAVMPWNLPLWQAMRFAAPALDAVGSRTVWLDEVGQPSGLKLAYNAWVLTTVEGLAESLTLADALGVDPKLVAEVIRGSALDSGYVQAKAPKMISDDLDAPSFPLVAAAKDAVLITDAARGAGLRLGIAETVRERLQLAVESGFGRADVAATYRVSRRPTTG